MALHIVVHPRFGDTARVTTEATGRPQLVADIDTGGTFSVQVDDEPGSTELAAQFARELATAALRFAQRCAELMSAPAVAAPAAPGDRGASNNA
jgi:proline racemase